MKVLVVHNDYQSQQIGGEDIVVNREIAGLKSALGEDNVFSYRVSNDLIRIGKLLKRLWGDKDHAKAIEKLVLAHDIDIVHVHNFFPLLTPTVFQAAKEAGAFVVHTLHNFRWWCSAGTLYRPTVGHCMQCVDKKWGYPAVLHGCYRHSRVQSLATSMAFAWYEHQQMRDYIDAYFVLTEFQRQKLAECGLHDKCWLKPNPIEVPHTFVSPSRKKDYLFVGRCESSKGLPLLLKIWKTLPTSFILRVIGDGEERDILEQTYAASNIRFYGNLPQVDVLKKMGESRYLIHTGLAYETFGLTMVEAMAQGTPVIGLNIGTRPELIQNGMNGYIAEEEQLREIILKSLPNTMDSNTFNNITYESMHVSAIETAKRFYLPTVMAQQVQLYHHFLESKQGFYAN